MADEANKTSFSDLAVRIGSMGDRPDDSDAEKLKHRLLVFMGLLMSGGGIMWGSIALYFGLLIPAIVPYGYVVITALNLSYFRATRNFVVARMVQVLLSLLLPFFFQWSLGGFGASGSVMLWAMLALVGSLTFSEARSAQKWLATYVLLTIFSGLTDALVREEFSPDPSEGARTFFFVANIVVISSIVFGLTIYLLFERERATDALATANARITELNEHLEDEVADRTQELQTSLARFQAILNNMADGLVAVGVNGDVQAANPAFSEMLFLHDKIVGRPSTEALPLALATLAVRSMESNEVEKLEVLLPGDRIGAAVASPIHAGGDQSASKGSVVLLRDVTLEKEIDRMKTDFIATVSHELRTPLTSVLGFAKLSKNKLEANVFPHVPKTDKKGQRAVKQVAGNVDIVVSEAQRLTALINDVLDISKMEAGRMEWKMEAFDPSELVRRAFAATAGLFEGGSVELKTDIADELLPVQGDFDRLLQVLVNLVSNAAKFTDEGTVTIGAKLSGKKLQLGVSDTGSGIEEADQSAIFKKFKQVGDTLTNKPQGTGLGLPICRQIVSAHDGVIEVTSELGKGSTFTVVLPVETHGKKPSSGEHVSTLAALVERIEHTVDRALPELGGDILVVDDDENLREMIKQQLNERGYHVRQAANGYDAIQAVRTKRPDLVVLDVMMPEISGFDVAAVLKSDPQTSSIPILILSIVQDKERGYSLGIDKYLTKPTEADELVSAVQKLLTQVHSSRRVLFVDKEKPAGPDVVRLLEAKGYHVVGSCAGDEVLEEARRTKPDLIIVEASYAKGSDVVQAIRLEKDLAHVYVVQLLDNSSATAPGGP